MELNEFKEVWKDEQKKLVARIKINEKRIDEITTEKYKNKFINYKSISILGKNLALVYFIISIWFASKLFSELLYSIPAIIGGFAMLFSFYQHRSLKKENYNSMNLIELQKAIYKFRIHTMRYAKFDKGITVLWILTLAPIYLKGVYHISIFSNLNHLIFFSIIVFISMVIIKIVPFDVYKKMDTELKMVESRLKEIENFELE